MPYRCLLQGWEGIASPFALCLFLKLLRTCSIGWTLYLTFSKATRS